MNSRLKKLLANGEEVTDAEEGRQTLNYQAGEIDNDHQLT
jgi:hypothetical protein